MCEVEHRVQWEHSEIYQAWMVKTGFSKDTVPELRFEAGLCGCPSSQREERTQRHTDGDHDGMSRSFQGFSLAGTGEGLLSVWQVMSLKKHLESHGGAHVSSQGSWTLFSTLCKLKDFNQGNKILFLCCSFKKITLVD